MASAAGRNAAGPWRPVPANAMASAHPACMDVQIPYARRAFGATLGRMDLKHFRTAPHARHFTGRTR
ncbi:MAG: hypothetical protein RSP_28100 [Rhodanobacter sp.]